MDLELRPGVKEAIEKDFQELVLQPLRNGVIGSPLAQAYLQSTYTARTSP